MGQTVHVNRVDIAQSRIVDTSLAQLGEGELRLRIESFSVTANNVTYAVVGDAFGYWKFFPGEGDWGVVPMWGHAVVEASNNPAIAIGERVYGYLPMATHLGVLPTGITPAGFSDGAAHRQPMSPIYNQYSRLAADLEHDSAREAERMIFGPLFKTGFLIEAMFRREGWFGADRVVITSASSKTAMALASVARDKSPEVRRIGLTSAANVAFVRAGGFYDEVLVYDDVAALELRPSVSVDFAGNAAVLLAIHSLGQQAALLVHRGRDSCRGWLWTRQRSNSGTPTDALLRPRPCSRGDQGFGPKVIRRSGSGKLEALPWRNR